MLIDLITMVLNIIVILILFAHLFQNKKDDETTSQLYDKYRNQDGLLMRNKNQNKK